MKSVSLNNGVEIPAIGFGTYKSTTGADGWKVVAEAIDAGYRHLDTERSIMHFSQSLEEQEASKELLLAGQQAMVFFHGAAVHEIPIA